MTERKQDALSTNFLLGLLDTEVNSKGEDGDEIRINVRQIPKVNNDQSIGHLANRIVEEVQVTTPRQRAKNVLIDAGITVRIESNENFDNSHRQHVGERAKKIPLNQQTLRPIRRVKKQSPTSRRNNFDRAPHTTRNRPSLGMEHETPRPARNTNKSQRKKPRRKSFFRR
jgi:hypothetical protein